MKKSLNGPYPTPRTNFSAFSRASRSRVRDIYAPLYFPSISVHYRSRARSHFRIPPLARTLISVARAHRFLSYDARLCFNRSPRRGIYTQVYMRVCFSTLIARARVCRVLYRLYRARVHVEEAILDIAVMVRRREGDREGDKFRKSRNVC